MSKTAEVMIDLGYKQRIVADEWVASNGSLMLRLDGKSVALFNRWVSVKWATEEKLPEYAPLEAAAIVPRLRAEICEGQ